MSDDFRYQLSIKLGPNGQDMLNVRASEWGEFKAALDNVVLGSESIAQVGDHVRAVGVVQPLVQPVPSPPPFAPQQAAPAQFPQAPAPQATPGDPNQTCHHGARVYKTNKPGAAKVWAAWMCPAGQNDPTRCEPNWVSTR